MQQQDKFAGTQRSDVLQLFAAVVAFAAYHAVICVAFTIFLARSVSLGWSGPVVAGAVLYLAVGLASLALARFNIRLQTSVVCLALGVAGLLLDPSVMRWVHPAQMVFIAVVLIATAAHEIVLFGFRQLRDDWQRHNRAGTQSRSEKIFRLLFGY